MDNSSVETFGVLLDVGLVVFTGAGAIVGVRAGGIRANVSFITFVAALRLSLAVRGEVGGVIARWSVISVSYVDAVAFACTLVVVRITLGVFAERLAWWLRVPRTLSEGWWIVDRVTGAIPGAASAATLAWLLVSLLGAVDRPSGFRRVGENAPVAVLIDGRMKQMVPSFASLANRVAAGRAVSSGLMIEPGPEVIPPRDERPSSRPDIESEVVALVNQARTGLGLPPLDRNDTLDRVARAHSDDMLRRGYFDHRSPDGTTPVGRLANVGFLVPRAGENIAFAPDLGSAHSGLMASPSHRANILSQEFSRVGVGVVFGADGLMVTQMFAT